MEAENAQLGPWGAARHLRQVSASHPALNPLTNRREQQLFITDDKREGSDGHGSRACTFDYASYARLGQAHGIARNDVIATSIVASRSRSFQATLPAIHLVTVQCRCRWWQPGVFLHDVVVIVKDDFADSSDADAVANAEKAKAGAPAASCS